jgi:hypothetical protein
MQVKSGCCSVCGKKIRKHPSGVQIQLQIAGAESWPVMWLLLCEKHGREVYQAACAAACAAACEKAKEAGE